MTTTEQYQTPTAAKVEIATLQVLANNNALEFLKLANQYPEYYSACMAQVERNEKIVERLEKMKNELV
jgi:hypothetical protein